MRALIDVLTFGDYRFVIEFDSGSSPGEEVVVWAYDAFDAPVRYRDRKNQYRCYFSLDDSLGDCEEFCEKFASDAEFRDARLAAFGA